MDRSTVPVTAGWAETFAAAVYGLTVDARPLESREETNFLLVATTGERFVLKLSSSASDAALVQLQNRAMLRLERQLPDVRCPAPVRTADGRHSLSVTVGGQPFTARVLTFVEGVQLRTLGYLSSQLLQQLGAAAGRLVTSLAQGGALGTASTGWDLRRAPAMVERCLNTVADVRRRRMGERIATSAQTTIDRLEPFLRLGTIHGDLTDENVLVARDDASAPVVTGIIDFGDLGTSWRSAELAILIASCLAHAPGIRIPVTLAAAFHREVKLTPDEIDALAPLVGLRLAAVAIETDARATLHPTNHYVTDAVEREWRALAAFSGVADIMRPALRHACGLDPCPRGHGVPRRECAVPMIDGLSRRSPVVDLSARSEPLEAGAWRDPRRLAAVIDRQRVDGIAVGQYGEGRILYGESGGTAEPATVHLGIDLFASPDTSVRSPTAGRVERASSHGLTIVGADIHLRVGGIVPSVRDGACVDSGDVIGTIAVPPREALLPAHAHVQLCVESLPELPGVVPASEAEVWKSVCPDPGPLVGLGPSVQGIPVRSLLARRRRHLARAQEHYYTEPPEIVRGWRQWLYDACGRAYLDMVNNVAVIGHSHPRVTEAATRQLRLLNTNSRFHYESIVRYTERLAGLTPDPLDTVFLVSSGSEANDLALLIARVVTGRTRVIALEGAYHGWTAATAAVSRRSRRRDSAVVTVPPPDTYRGYSGEGAGQRHAKAVRQALTEPPTAEEGVAAFIAEPFNGTAGGLTLPEGYLTEVYGAVREAGGLCIADEIQAGYGRLGRFFWGFEQQQVTPDIVTAAKATGNGHPVAAVITTRAVAEEFADRGAWFSSVGGGPVSCEIGLAVLDVLEQESLQQHAHDVGAYFKRSLEELTERHEICGAVHGLGLYLGLELVKDRDTLSPAPRETAALCERMLDLGVVVQPTGRHDSVLKIKPPLVVTREDVNHVVKALDTALSAGWQ